MVQESIYLASNCSAAYQLNWSLSLFGKISLPQPEFFLDPLNNALAADDLKILESRSLQRNVVQFFVGSRPKHSPSFIVRAVKGRWQAVARGVQQIDFRRNYRIQSVGAAKGRVIDEYVARQDTRHPMIDPQLQQQLEKLQFFNPIVEPEEIRRSSYGQFVHALHIVLEMEYGYSEKNMETLARYQAMIVGACSKHQWRLSRIGLVCNHMHILLAAGVNESPESVALSLLNNLAYTQGMKPVFKFGYYVGTFGRYDRGAIWNAMRGQIVSG